MISLEQVANQCDKVRWKGKRSFTACCVAHEDRNPSMSVTEAGDGTILIHCHAGCPQVALLDAVGISANCKPKAVYTQRKPRVDKPTATTDYAHKLWAAATDEDPPFSSEPHPDGYRVDTHPYSITKRITHAFGARRGSVSGRLVGKGADCILNPNRDWDGNLIGVEAINANGLKQTYGSKGLMVLGMPEDAEIVHACEGWATAWAISQLFPRPFACIVAFGKSKLESLAEAARVRYRGMVVIHCDDSDNRDVWDTWQAGGGEQYAASILRRIYGG